MNHTTQSDAILNAHGGRLDPKRVAHTIIEPYPFEVLITANGVTLAHTENGLLLRETYAPDIYIPAADVRFERLPPSEIDIYCPYKLGVAKHYHAVVAGARIENVAWCYIDPLGQPVPRQHQWCPLSGFLVPRAG